MNLIFAGDNGLIGFSYNLQNFNKKKKMATPHRRTDSAWNWDILYNYLTYIYFESKLSVKLKNCKPKGKEDNKKHLTVNF